MKLNKIIAAAFFLISVHFLFTYLGFYKQLHRRPCSVHSWAQCERASIALNYYQVDMNFFLPKIHKNLDGQGITGLEFPFVNYSVAIIYKLFGFNEFYYRMFVLCTLLFGLLMFYFLSYSLTKNYLLSLATIALAYFSPVLLFYSANFLPDTTSLGFVLAAWFFAIKYFNTSSKKFFYLFFGFALLAALVKITSLIIFGVVIGLVILDHFRFFHKTRNNTELIANKMMVLLYSFAAIAIVFGWYKYAGWLSEKYHSDAFLLNMKVVTDKKEAMAIWKYIQQRWINDYYPEDSYYLMCYVMGALLIGAKFVSRLLFAITFLTFLGSCCFVFLLFFQFRNHDYYVISLMPVVFLLFLTFADMISRIANNYFPPLKLLVVVLFALSAKESLIYCKGNFSYRYNSYNFLINDSFIVYEDLEQKLRSLGVKHSDVTVSGFDYTYCNSLYLMNQTGWTFDEYSSREWIEHLVNTRNAKYMVLNDTAMFNKIYPNTFKDKIIGSHRGLFIFKLK